MKKLLTLTLVAIGSFANAQNMMKYLYNFTPYDVAPCTAGGYITCGTDGNAAVVKTDAQGNVQWAKELSNNLGMMYPRATSVGELQGGTGYFVLVNDDASGYENLPYVLVKLDLSGNVTASYYYFTQYLDYPYSSPPGVKQLANGNFLVTATQWERMEVFCTSSSGNLLWTRTVRDDSIKDPGLASVTCSDGGLMLLGKRNDDLIIIKTDANGNTQWSKIFNYNGANYLRALDIIKTADGNLVITGIETQDTINWTSHFALMKINNSGNVLWHKNYFTSNIYESCMAKKVVELPSTELVVLGETTNAPGILMMKTDANGNIVQLAEAGSLNNYYNNQSMRLAGANNIVLSGTNNILFTTDYNFGFSCTTNTFTLTTTNVPNPPSITAVTNISTTGMAQGTVTITANSFVPSIADYCSVFSVNEVGSNSNIVVYPNPMSLTAIIKVDAPQTLTNAYAQLFDVTGKKVAEVKLANNQAALQRGDLQSGIYFYKVISENSVIGTGKISVQ